MIIEDARPGGASWRGIFAERGRACGWALLGVVAGSAVVDLAVVTVIQDVTPSYQLLQVLLVVVLAVLSAYQTGVAMRLLAFGPRPDWAAVLRVPPRQLGLMALWSVLLSVWQLKQLLWAFQPEWTFELMRGPGRWPLLVAATLTGALAAPLAAVAFLEGGGVRACWRLLVRGGGATAARLCAIAFGVFVAGQLLQWQYTELFVRGTSRLGLQAFDLLSVPVGLAGTLALFATYRRSPAARPTLPLGGPPAPAGPSAYPPVDAAFDHRDPSGTVGA
ncbi:MULTISPECIES: hypothetical protein [Kitasatospora]|uniref:Uncharacterized protein n=1 Tax=Kitasatospora setae (strain ATCC 33774 / DSM 43861 / JCM 3304 / KCC A-0304 / NBRC 14216 / KM-6054) TaxID=452652 RepID=E4N102_KITSK|nr:MULTISPECIES: hypothetical protein [Kitasatospora]BAJ31836.1 hypothetical protein KSE_60700 [Kitasatospora setae KM-6054]